MLVTRRSVISGKEHTREIDVDPAKLDAWYRGQDDRCVQQVFPNLSASDREFLMSGATDEEWGRLFPPDEEEDVP